MLTPPPSISSSKLIPSIAGKLALAGGTLAFGSWLLGDLMHLPGGGAGFLALGAGFWWMSRPSRPSHFSEPSSFVGWIRRCETVLAQFSELELALGFTCRMKIFPGMKIYSTNLLQVNVSYPVWKLSLRRTRQG